MHYLCWMNTKVPFKCMRHDPSPNPPLAAPRVAQPEQARALRVLVRLEQRVQPTRQQPAALLLRNAA